MPEFNQLQVYARAVHFVLNRRILGIVVVAYQSKITEFESGWWFITSRHKLLMSSQKVAIPYGNLNDLGLSSLAKIPATKIAELDGEPCYLIDLVSDDVMFDYGEFYSIKRLLHHHDDRFFGLGSNAWQIANFLRTHQFCGQCANPMQWIDWELASVCHDCNHRCYPRISPCIIVAIYSDKDILLARSKRHDEGFYSVIAGFVESGETLEQALHREVKEEVSVSIKNIRYFGSQPWPFPHSLMIGFTAEYKGDEIQVDNHEILEASWFALNDLPNVPNTTSIAGQLIKHLEKTKLR